MRNVLAAALVLVGTLGAAAQDWLPVREIGLEVAPGGPLDFSQILPNGQISDDRRLIVANGRFAMSDRPEVPEPLLCASLGWSPASGGFPDHDGADRYARQLAMHGYNAARFHFLESALMFNRAGDFDFDPEELDRVQYFMAALKREGISWLMDGMTSARGALGGYDDRWDGVGDLKQTALLTPEGREHWRRMQEKILGTVNPYTGLAPIHDPALALIVLVNEGGLEFDSIVMEGQGQVGYSPLITARFNDWLRKNYASTAELASVWGDLGADESIEDGTIRLPTNRYGTSPRYPDVQRFFIEAEADATAEMSADLRAMGYTGAITNFNNWPILQGSVSRRDLEVSAMNTYFDWVSSYSPGTRIEQTSSIEKGLDYIRAAAGTRWLGKPFLLTEYDHLFWNRYRYEAGLAMPAVAAFQGWDGICRHGHGPIALRYGEDLAHKTRMLPYAIALDPVARAGETLAALLFRRGDVAQSGVTIPFATRGTEGLGDAIAAREPENLTALMAFGAIGLSEGAEGGVPVHRASTSFAAMVEQLRESGQIDDAALAALGQGELRSDTGEISITPEARRMQVVTERTVAAAFDTLAEPLELGPLTLRSATAPALFSVSALDDRALSESREMLVIFATDAHNSGMRFAGWDQREIVDFGQLPVLIAPGAVDLTLAGEGRWSIAPVGLDGVVGAQIAEGVGAVELTLENSTAAGPTTYFVLSRD